MTFEPTPGHMRAVADKDSDMRELAERFARQDETRAAAEWEIVGAMDDEGVVVTAQPTQTCLECGRVLVVQPDGRGFPPDITRRKLEKLCRADGHKARPQYRAGVLIRRPDTPLTDRSRVARRRVAPERLGEVQVKGIRRDLLAALDAGFADAGIDEYTVRFTTVDVGPCGCDGRDYVACATFADRSALA